MAEAPCTSFTPDAVPRSARIAWFARSFSISLRLVNKVFEKQQHSEPGEYLIWIKNAIDRFYVRLFETEQSAVRRSARNDAAETLHWR